MKKKLFSLVGFLITAALAACNISGVYAEDTGMVKETIDFLEVGEPVYYENLTVIPVYTTNVKDPTHYTTLDEAFKKGLLKITEINGGSVPQVKLTNLSDKYIYIMGGEVLSGCKQDRMVGRDVLIKPGSKNIVVPVYCVEHGRWTYESDGFYSKGNLGIQSLRAEAQIASSGAQSTIWNKISRVNSRLSVQTATGNYQDAYEHGRTQERIKCFEKEIKDIPGLKEDTVGVVIGVGNTILSVDIFANPYLFRKEWPKILKSSALSAISSDNSGVVTQEDAADFLKSLHGKKYVRKEAVDLGFELTVLDEDLNVNALVYRTAVIHLAGFVPEGEDRSFKKPDDSERRIPVMRRQ